MEWAEVPIIGGLFDNPNEKRVERGLREQQKAYAKEQKRQGKAGKAAMSEAMALYNPYSEQLDAVMGRNAAAQQRVMQPGAGEQFYADNQGAFTQPGALQDNWNRNRATFQQMQGGERYVQAALQQPRSNALGNALQGMSQGLAAQSAAEGALRPGQQALMQPGAQQQLAAALGGLQDRSTFSDQAARQAFAATQSGPGLDPYYDRAAQKTEGRLATSLAARGLGNSSYALNAQAEAQAALGAEQANREAEYAAAQRQAATAAAGQADATRQGLINTTAGLAQGADQTQLQRALGGMQLAQGADQGMLARYGMLGDMSGRLDAQALQHQLGTGNLALGMQDAQMGRIGMGMQGAGAADAMRQQQLMNGMQAAMNTQNMAMGREQFGMGIDQMGLDNQFRQQQAQGAGMQSWNDMLYGRQQALMDAQWASQAAANQSALDASARRAGANAAGLQTLVGAGLAATGAGGMFGAGGAFASGGAAAAPAAVGGMSTGIASGMAAGNASRQFFGGPTAGAMPASAVGSMAAGAGAYEASRMAGAPGTRANPMGSSYNPYGY